MMEIALGIKWGNTSAVFFMPIFVIWQLQWIFVFVLYRICAKYVPSVYYQALPKAQRTRGLSSAYQSNLF